MDTNILDFVVERLGHMTGAELEAFAKEVGVPEGTARKIKYREVKDPRISSVQALYDGLRAKEAVDLTPPKADGAQRKRYTNVKRHERTIKELLTRGDSVSDIAIYLGCTAGAIYPYQRAFKLARAAKP